MTCNNLKKVKYVLAIFTALLMAGCSQQNMSEAQETSEVTTALTTSEFETSKASEKENLDETSNTGKVKADTEKFYTEAKDLIGRYINSYIGMNYEGKSIYSKEELVNEYSSEGGALTKFYDKNDNLLRCRVVLYGSMGKVEANYYFIDNQHGYYTMLYENYNAPLTSKSAVEALNYKFSEYWFDNISIYSIDNVNGALVECNTNPIIEPLSEYVNV
jgi:hypothetical protein